ARPSAAGAAAPASPGGTRAARRRPWAPRAWTATPREATGRSAGRRRHRRSARCRRAPYRTARTSCLILSRHVVPGYPERPRRRAGRIPEVARLDLRRRTGIDSLVAKHLIAHADRVAVVELALPPDAHERAVGAPLVGELELPVVIGEAGVAARPEVRGKEADVPLLAPPDDLGLGEVIHVAREPRRDDLQDA